MLRGGGSNKSVWAVDAKASIKELRGREINTSPSTNTFPTLNFYRQSIKYNSGRGDGSIHGKVRANVQRKWRGGAVMTLTSVKTMYCTLPIPHILPVILNRFVWWLL